MPVCESCKHGGLCSTRCCCLLSLHAPPAPLTKAHASSAALPVLYMVDLSCAWLLGLAVELDEVAAVAGNAAERRKRVVWSRDTEHDLNLPRGTC